MSAGSEGLSLRLMQLPARPHPDVGPSGVVHTCCLALQHNNVPTAGAGVRRLFEFCTFECRAALTARQGARTVERFVQYAHSPAFSELVNAARFSVSKPTLIEGTPTSGALATVIVAIDGWATDGASEEDSSEEGGESPNTARRFRWMLQRERRPPNAGCWFVTEVVALEHWYLFNGDSGSTTTD
jgi:hypothetical protein